MESRHVDVLEMDAASHTGVENIRQITDAVRYAPATARYKVYIIDEVHMLSAAAFNAFLKTLEEPPPHAKFVFATTEIRKVPVTILSRCQRFDLRRVESDKLVRHLGTICASGSASTFSLSAMLARLAISRSASTRRRSKRWQRDSTVIGTLRISVVAKMNFACAGGSSSVFRNALNAAVDSMCTSSMM